MPIKQKDGKWYWGSQGPFKSKKKAEEVARAAHAAGFAKTEIGQILEGEKPHLVERPLTNHPSYPPRDKTRRKRLDWTENTPTAKLIKDKSYLHPEQRDWRKAPNENTKGSPPYVNDDPKEPKIKSKHPVSHSHRHLHKEGDGGDSSGSSFGGTVFTSTNAGIFSPTYGEREAKSKKKRSGVEKLGVYLTDGSPTKKSKQLTKKHTKESQRRFIEPHSTLQKGGDSRGVSKSAGLELVEWLLKQDENDANEAKDDLQKPIQRDAEQPPESAILAEQQDMENKIKILADQDKKRRNGMEENANSPTGAEGSLPDNGVGQSRAFALSKEPMAWGPYANRDELKRTARLDVDDDDYAEEFEKAMGHLYEIAKEDDNSLSPVAASLLDLMKEDLLDTK